MAQRHVKTILSDDGQHRLLIYQRDDGLFEAKEEMTITGSKGDAYWSVADPSHFRPFICDSVEHAEREGLGRVDWQPSVATD
jgi:hypothetical protein